MQALQYVELDLPYCANTYSVLPCTASFGGSPSTGTAPCFNCRTTCQDIPNYINDPVTLRFAVPTNFLPSEIDCVPSIKSIVFDPATISLGENLGQRATLTVTFEDHRDADTGPGGDPYVAQRDYDAYSQGTYWGKFRARHPYLIGRPLRWINGEVGDALADMETRHFIVDSFSGPTPDGQYTLIAKDVLKLADGSKALAPVASTGFLVADITAIATTATLSPAGIGNTEYPASGKVNIGGKEICSFTRAADVLTLTRAQDGTAASTHAAQDLVQLVLEYSADDAADIIADLLENYAGVNPSYIPLATWQGETAAYLNRVYTAIIPNPTSVNTLISELIQQAGLSMWWNDRDQSIGLLVLRGILSDAVHLTEQNVMADSLAITEQPDKRLSQVHVYFGQINPLTSLTDESNYRSKSINIDTQAEIDYGSPAIKKIYSRWIPALGRSVADRLGTILLSRFRDPPRHFKLNILRGSLDEIVLARGYLIESWAIQDETGAADTAPVQVTRLRNAADLIGIEADEVLFTTPDEDLSTRNIIIDSNINNVDLRDAHDSLYPTPESGDVVVCTINAGVIVGSTSTSLPAFDVGTWPAGVDITVIVNGRVQGAGGNGGDKGTGADHPGKAGGTALYTLFPIDLDVASGEIFGGGGGGGWFVAQQTAGGGGGAGSVPGLGGSAAAADGHDGTTEAGGLGGVLGGGHGGNGGGPGLAGETQSREGGAAGSAIDGVSFVTVTVGPGDIRGTQVN